MPFHPYLFFGGNCREAFTRYQEIFGGALQLIRMGDTPDAEDVAPEQADLIIHPAPIYDDHLLMASDNPMSEVFGPVQGMMVSYEAADAADARRVYAELAEGGEVTQDLIETFFSPAFGMCVDRFGTPWMISAPGPEGVPG